MSATTSHDMVAELETKHNRDRVDDLDDDLIHEAEDTCYITSFCEPLE